MLLDPEEMKISYLFKRKRKLRFLDDEELIEIGKNFESGKAPYENDKSIDSFNFDSIIYSNICYPIETDQKDLTLDRRILYFHPHYSYCESTYMYDYIDVFDFCKISIEIIWILIDPRVPNW